jgi:hypothetical protein
LRSLEVLQRDAARRRRPCRRATARAWQAWWIASARRAARASWLQRSAPRRRFAPLPHALVLHILSLLPVDCRLLCAGVCRSWRAALEERSLWLRLDLSASGVSPKRAATCALLHAAAARAGGELLTLDISGCARVTFDALLAVLTANGALRELRMCGIFTTALRHPNTEAMRALLNAAPRLVVCEVDVVCRELALARRLLRSEPPFVPVHVRSFEFAGEAPDEAAVLALAADFTSHAHLRRLHLNFTPLNTAAALDAVVDASLTRQLTSVTLRWCSLSPDSVPALVRLVGGGALSELNICGDDDALRAVDAPAALALGSALRASSTIKAFTARAVGLLVEPAAATALLGALTGHPSLRSLSISHNAARPASREQAGAVLAALIAANAPALHELDVSSCWLLDAGMGPLFDALPANTHLRTLVCERNELSDVFVRERLLPAVRANSSLRELKTGLETDARGGGARAAPR